MVTIVDDEQTLRFAAPGFSAVENRGPASITVERLGVATGTVLVDFNTVNGTATSPGDYAAVARTLTFGPGVRTVTVPVTIVNDSLIEGNETFDLRLSPVRLRSAAAELRVGHLRIGAAAECVVPVTIVDDDQGGQVQFSAATYTAAETAATAVVTLVRSGGLGGPVTVDFVTVDGTGTASALLDYTPVVRTLTFAANATTQTSPSRSSTTRSRSRTRRSCRTSPTRAAA